MGSRRAGRGLAVLVACVLAGPIARAGADDKPLPPPRVRRLDPRPPGAAPPPPAPPGPAAAAPRPEPPPRPAVPPGPPVAPDRPTPAAPTAEAPPRSLEPGPEDLSAGLPRSPPPRPEASDEPGPGEMGFEVARPGGTLRVLADEEDPDGRRIVVMMGNPRIHRPAHERVGADGRRRRVEALDIQANHIVAWIDRRGFPGIDAYGDLGLAGAAPATGDGPKEARRTSASVVPEDVLGIYAEGAVLLSFGDQRFEAEALYVDPHAYRGLLAAPRIDGRVLGIEAPDARGLPLFLRARRARLVARGLVVLDDAEASTSLADDRIALTARTLVVEEHAPARDERGERPHALGFQASSTQRLVGQDIVLRGERIPLLRVSQLEFGLSEAGEAFPTVLQGVRAGSQGHLGRFGFVELGGDVGGGAGRPPARWFVEAGGYTKRGPALLPGLAWNTLDGPFPLKSVGRLDGFLVAEQADFDRSGLDPPDLRQRWTLESRTILSTWAHLDVEANLFSDRGVNDEFFERDELEHKDRETYARLDVRPPATPWLVATLDAKVHARDFATETTEEPRVSAWIQSLPVLQAAGRRGPTLDLVAFGQAGRLVRHHDVALALDDIEAWRLSQDARLALRVPVGDARLVAYGGVSWDRYEDVVGHDPDDLDRRAVLAGVALHVQAHRTSRGVRGGFYGLDGLRQVVEGTLRYDVREGSGPDPEELPDFDRRELERDRHAIGIGARSRWQTRREDGTTRTVLDLSGDLEAYVDDRGPRGIDSPGLLRVRARGEPRERFHLDAEVEWDLAAGIEVAHGRFQWDTRLDRRPLRLSLGYSHVEDTNDAVTLEAAWRFSTRYAVEALSHIDWGSGDDLHRLLFRRYSEDHAIAFGFEVRGDDVQFEIAFTPAVGGVAAGQRPLFRDVFDPSDAWRDAP